MLLHDLIYGEGNKAEAANRKVPIHSLDMETTGLNHKENRIWSIAIEANDPSKSFESFIGGIIPKDSKRPIYDFMAANVADGSEVFANKQLASGAFNSYFDAFHNTQNNIQGDVPRLENLNDAVNKAGKILKEDPGILLIQNVNFEKEGTKEATFKRGPQGLSESTRLNFVDGAFKNLAGGSPIQVDPNINDARIAFNMAVKNQMKLTGAGKEVLSTHKNTERLRLAADNLDKTIAKTVIDNMDKKKNTVLDLMDTTKLYLTDLHLNDTLDAGFLKTGTKVDYLSQDILKEIETHTSLMDANQQTRIFDILNQRRSSIRKNGVSDVDRAFAAKLSDPKTDLKFFLSGLAENLQSMDENTATADSIRSVFKESLDRRRNVPSGGFGRKAYTESVVNDFEAGKSMSEILQRVTTEAEDINIKNYVDEALPKTKESKGVLGSVKKNWKTNLMLGGAAMVGLGMVSSGPQRQKEELKEKTKVDTYTELYDNLYAGQSYADWQQRNNAHKMTY